MEVSVMKRRRIMAGAVLRALVGLIAFSAARDGVAQVTQACDPSSTRGLVIEGEAIVWPAHVDTIALAPLANDRDYNGGTLTITSAVLGNPALGRLVTSSDRQYLFFTPASAAYPGDGQRIDYTVGSSTGGGGSASMTFVAEAQEPAPDFTVSCESIKCYFTAIPGDTVGIRSYDWTFAEQPRCNVTEWRGQTVRCWFDNQQFSSSECPPEGTKSSMNVELTVNYYSGKRKTIKRCATWTSEPPKFTWHWYNDTPEFRGLVATVQVSCPTCSTPIGCSPATDDLFWDWGDGTGVQTIYTCNSGGVGQYPQTIQHRYASPGVYLAKAIVMQGGTQRFAYPDETGRRIEVINAAPVVTVSASPNYSRVHVGVRIQDDAIYENTDVARAPTYTVDFGDGTIQNVTPSSVHQTGVSGSFEHKYEAVGQYVVSVTATDVHGASTTASANVNVAELLPKADFTISCAEGDCTFDATRSERSGSFLWEVDGVPVPETAQPVLRKSLSFGGHVIKLWTAKTYGGALSDPVTRIAQVRIRGQIPAMKYFDRGMPCRLFDSRVRGYKVNAGDWVPIDVSACAPEFAGHTDAAANINVVVIEPTAVGHARVFTGAPNATALMPFQPESSPRANNATVRLHGGAYLDLVMFPAPSMPGAAHMVIDLYGMYSAETPASVDCAKPTSWCGPMSFVPLPQHRLFDSRLTPPRAEPGVPRFVSVNGTSQIPLTWGVRAVAMTATAVVPPGPGGNLLIIDSFTAKTCGDVGTCPERSVSTMSYRPGRAIANGVIARVGTDSSAGHDVVAWARGAATDLVLDVSGVFGPNPARLPGGGLSYVPLSDVCRVLDTRDVRYGHGKFTSGEPSRIQIAGQCGVPASARAVVMTTTVVNPVATGYFRLYPSDRPRPVSTVLLFGPGDVIGNTSISEIVPGNLYGLTGEATIFSNDATAAVDVVMDVAGYFQ